VKDYFDIPEVPQLLVCSKCGTPIMSFDYPISWPQETFFSKYHHDYATRVYNLIRHHIAKHVCEKRLCSGYGVLPNGKQCIGCSDCEKGDAKAYNEILSNQTYLDEHNTNLHMP
jgi:hypothetical protein